ncbi:gastrula zinc finger protein XlCGF28.1-like isoform X5 [Synchiropus splendidus]|uniref:gastrula zinc finger protein XlCGF28.1-like isoform X5 n=1 Tax=Synchiropus splendidus TaxID=270530 RepID=UPI00237E9E08|nr:gastrula zinc finger protein XlCGF28.1-like isoform X5 [Synchiropus splendidus]
MSWCSEDPHLCFVSHHRHESRSHTQPGRTWWRAEKPDVQVSEEALTEPQEYSTSLNEEEDEPRRLKEEAEEVEVSSLSITPVAMKIEEDEVKEESPTSSWAQHVKSEADEDSCGGPEPPSDWAPLGHQRTQSSESDTDDSEDWSETTDIQLTSKSVENPNINFSEKNNADDKSLTCSKCGRKCASKSGLALHMNSCSGASLTCSVCGKSCESRAALQIHMRAHSGERPFNCMLCGKCYSRRGHLNVHMRSHNGERPFSCRQCGKCYTRSEQLTRHMKIHTGEKPFICPVCEKCFRLRECLKEHMKIHTEAVPAEAHESPHWRKTLRLF